MTLGVALGYVALGVALAAATLRTRDRFWVILGVLVVAPVGYRVAQSTLDTSRFVAHLDGALVAIGFFLLAAMVTLTLVLPTTIQKRLVYGAPADEEAFEHALFEVRRPFVSAGAEGNSIEEKARWRSQLSMEPPTPEWASLTQRIAAGDEEFGRLVRLGSPQDDWLGWVASNDQIVAEWKDLSGRSRELRRRRARRAALLAKVAFVASAGLVLAGWLDVSDRFLAP